MVKKKKKKGKDAPEFQSLESGDIWLEAGS